MAREKNAKNNQPNALSIPPTHRNELVCLILPAFPNPPSTITIISNTKNIARETFQGKNFVQVIQKDGSNNVLIPKIAKVPYNPKCRAQIGIGFPFITKQCVGSALHE